MIADVGLPHKRTALAKDLSGNHICHCSYFLLWNVDSSNLFISMNMATVHRKQWVNLPFHLTFQLMIEITF